MAAGLPVKRESGEAGVVDRGEVAGISKRAMVVLCRDLTHTANRRDEVEDDSSHNLGHELEYLKKLEKLNASYDPSLKYVSVRKLLVGFIFDVCEELHLQTITIHRSVNYLDRLLSKRTDISRTAYQLLATACIFVAAKFEEQPNNVPTLCQLMSQSEGLHSKARLIEAEKLLLSELGWNALSATTLHFSHCYISRGVHCEGDTLDQAPLTLRDKAIIHKHMESFATFICLQDYSFVKYEHALLAAAGVAAARSICAISPVWPKELCTRLGYSFSEISDCLDSILVAANLNATSPAALSLSSATFGPHEIKPEQAEFDVSLSTSSKQHGEAGTKGGCDEEGSPRYVTAVMSAW